MREKVTRLCPQTTVFEEKGEPKRIQTEALLLTLRLTAGPNGLTELRDSHGLGDITVDSISNSTDRHSDSDSNSNSDRVTVKVIVIVTVIVIE